MKLKYLFSAIIASVLLLVGCEQEPIGTFEDIKLSSTNVSIPAEGGEVSVTLTTTIDWAFVTTDFEWLTLDGPTSGGAGEYVLKFSAEAVSGGRDLTLEIKAGSHSQYITIRQGTKAVENATCADVIAGVDGKVYRVTGVCTSIANDLYGNWYLKDATGEVYVYGTLDKDGATKNFASWKMAPGDVVTVEGPRKDYNGTIELVDVTVLNIEKSLLKIEEQPEAITKEGGEYQLTLLYKGLGVQPSVPAVDADGESVDYREWISVVDVETKFAEATKLDPNPADTALVTIKVLPNEGGARNGIINFTSGTDEASSTVSFEFTQEGSIAEVTVADFLAKEKGDALYKLTGKVSGLKPGDYGNFHLVDATGSVYVYGLTATPVAKNDKSFPTLGIREGDIVTLIGKRDRYDDAKVPEEKEQVGGPAYYVSHIGSTDVTVAEFLQKPESSDVRYRITGTVANIQMDKNDPTKESAYGNFDLVDGDASVLVYGLTIAPVEKNDLSFPKLGLKAGDVVTIVGTRTAFKGTPQVGGPAYYITHTPGETPGEGGEGGEGGEEPSEKAARNLAFSSATATATLGEAFTAPTLSGETDGVVYTSSNTAVATVDAATGAVTLVAAGETTITAAAEETETLQAGTASYTLTVSEAAVELPAGISAIKALATAAGASFNVTLNDAVVTYVSGSNAYVQDTEAGILIYKSGHGLIAGDKLSGEVSGTVKLYNNLREITEIDITKASKTQGAAIPVTELTLAELNAEGAYDRYENMRIKISKAEMTGDLEISQNGQTYALYKKNSSVKGFDLYNIVDVIGYPGKFYENVQLNVFEDATVSGATKTVLSGFNNVELAVGDTKANKATASSGATVSYSSAAENIATVDAEGNVTGVAEGETTITVSVEAYNGYPAATATCTVNVLPAGAVVEKAWTLVTDASTLAVGDKIVIAAKGSNVAISTEQKSNNRGQVAITKSGNTMTFTTAVQEITLEAGTKTGTFAFNVGSSGYLYAASSSSNYLKTGSKNDNASWKIEITSAGVATIKAQGTSTRNWLRHNSQSSLFACYESGQADVVIYKYQ